MRVLGVCPNCGAHDSIVAQEGPLANREEWDKATCTVCRKQWKHWLNLVSEQRGMENELVPVLVSEHPEYAKVMWPSDALRRPFGRLIVKVFNTALMVRFDLDVCFATEGGVQGIIGDESIELRNIYEEIGLFDYYGFKDGVASLEILPWYARMLRLLLEEELVVDDRNVGRGAILKISRDDQNGDAKAIGLLQSVLCEYGGEEFAKEVFERLAKELTNPFSRSHIAGLTFPIAQS